MKKDNFVSILEIHAISSFTALLDKFPLLEAVFKSSKNKDPARAWDFCVTVALSFLLQAKFQLFEREELIKVLNKEDPTMVGAFLIDLEGLVAEMAKDTDLDAIAGVWVLWNIKGGKLTPKEIMELPQVLGSWLNASVLMLIQEWDT